MNIKKQILEASRLLFNEKVNIYITIGGLVTLLGVYLVNKAFKAAVPPPEQPETEGM